MGNPRILRGIDESVVGMNIKRLLIVAIGIVVLRAVGESGAKRAFIDRAPHICGRSGKILDEKGGPAMRRIG
jgi:hypothetical protein